VNRGSPRLGHREEAEKVYRDLAALPHHLLLSRNWRKQAWMLKKSRRLAG
jgi:hypothetical protein